MKKFTLLLLVLCLMVACQEAPSSEKQSEEPVNAEVKVPEYPEALVKVLDKHGSLDKWKAMQTLKYDIVRENGAEKHTVDLHARRDRIESEKYTMGFDGQKAWVVADTSYKRDPKYMHNLMFYFYAMPFVLADEGIKYSTVDPINYEGVAYPGIKIDYNDGVGVSSKDEYILYYHPETYQMSWLGYTATFSSGEKSDRFNYIRYDDWGNFNGVILPNTISWYKHEEGKPIEPRNKVQFANIEVMNTQMEDELYAVPEGARVSE